MRKYLPTVIISLFLLSCDRDHLDIKSIWLDEKPTAENSYNSHLNICFDEPLADHESVYISFVFKTKTNRVFKWDNDYYTHDNKSCLENLSFIWKGTNDEDRDFMENHLKKGNIETLEIEVYNKYKGDLLFKHTYKDL